MKRLPFLRWGTKQKEATEAAVGKRNEQMRKRSEDKEDEQNHSREWKKENRR